MSETPSPRVRPARIGWLLLGLLLLLAAPFVAVGDHFARWTEAWRASEPSPPMVFAVVATLLAADVILPTPSSVVATFAGASLGWWWGGLATWLGLNAGAIAAFGLARWKGRPWVRQRVGEAELAEMQRTASRYGSWAVILARGLPLAAEASVFWLGLSGLAWRAFLPPLLLSNLGLAAAYAGFGDFAQQQEWLPAALAASAGAPLLAAWWLQRKLRPARSGGP